MRRISCESWTRLRIDFLHQDPASDASLTTLAPRLRNSFQFFGDDWLRTAGIGEFTGGGLNGLLAIGRAGWRGEDHSLNLNSFLSLVALRQQAHDQLIAEGFPDGISKLRVLTLPGHREIALPALPIGVIGNLGFSPDGKQLAVTLNSATAPSDVYVITLANATLARWTQSEVGGLDASKFRAPTLVRYETFDEVDGKRRTIPAWESVNETNTPMA